MIPIFPPRPPPQRARSADLLTTNLRDLGGSISLFIHNLSGSNSHFNNGFFTNLTGINGTIVNFASTNSTIQNEVVFAITGTNINIPFINTNTITGNYVFFQTL